MAEKAKCDLVLIVDGNGDYAVGRDFDAAKEAYENEIQELSACEGGFSRSCAWPSASLCPKSWSWPATHRPVPAPPRWPSSAETRIKPFLPTFPRMRKTP